MSDRVFIDTNLWVYLFSAAQSINHKKTKNFKPIFRLKPIKSISMDIFALVVNIIS